MFWTHKKTHWIDGHHVPELRIEATCLIGVHNFNVFFVGPAHCLSNVDWKICLDKSHGPHWKIMFWTHKKTHWIDGHHVPEIRIGATYWLVSIISTCFLWGQHIAFPMWTGRSVLTNLMVYIGRRTFRTQKKTLNLWTPRPWNSYRGYLLIGVHSFNVFFVGPAYCLSNWTGRYVLTNLMVYIGKITFWTHKKKHIEFMDTTSLKLL